MSEVNCIGRASYRTDVSCIDWSPYQVESQLYWPEAQANTADLGPVSGPI